MFAHTDKERSAYVTTQSIYHQEIHADRDTKPILSWPQTKRIRNSHMSSILPNNNRKQENQLETV